MTNLLFGCVMVSEPGHRGLLYRLTGQQQIMRRSCTDLTRRVRRHGSCRLRSVSRSASRSLPPSPASPARMQSVSQFPSCHCVTDDTSSKS